MGRGRSAVEIGRDPKERSRCGAVGAPAHFDGWLLGDCPRRVCRNGENRQDDQAWNHGLFTRTEHECSRAALLQREERRAS